MLRTNFLASTPLGALLLLGAFAMTAGVSLAEPDNKCVFVPKKDYVGVYLRPAGSSESWDPKGDYTWEVSDTAFEVLAKLMRNDPTRRYEYLMWSSDQLDEKPGPDVPANVGLYPVRCEDPTEAPVANPPSGEPSPDSGIDTNTPIPDETVLGLPSVQRKRKKIFRAPIKSSPSKNLGPSGRSTRRRTNHFVYVNPLVDYSVPSLAKSARVPASLPKAADLNARLPSLFNSPGGSGKRLLIDTGGTDPGSPYIPTGFIRKPKGVLMRLNVDSNTHLKSDAPADLMEKILGGAKS